MKLTFATAPIAAAVQAVRPAVAARGSSPIVGRCRLAADADGLAVTATDLELTVEARVPGAVGGRGGAAVVPHDRLLAALREAGAEATLEAGEKALRVRSDRGRWELPLADADAFPLPAAAPAGLTATLDAAALKAGLRATAFAIADNGGRYATGGLLVEPDPAGGRLVLAATDTHRVAVADVPAEFAGPAGRPAGPLIPEKAVKAVQGQLPAEGPVTLAIDDRSARVTAGPLSVTTALLEGRFPPWRDILKKLRTPAAAPELPAGDLAALVRGAAVACDKLSTRVDFRLSGGVLTATGRGSEGEAELSAACPGEAGEFEVSFGWDLLLSALRSRGPDEVVRWELYEPGLPTVFRPAGGGPGWLVIAMPLA